VRGTAGRRQSDRGRRPKAKRQTARDPARPATLRPPPTPPRGDRRGGRKRRRQHPRQAEDSAKQAGDCRSSTALRVIAAINLDNKRVTCGAARRLRPKEVRNHPALRGLPIRERPERAKSRRRDEDASSSWGSSVTTTRSIRAVRCCGLDDKTSGKGGRRGVGLRRRRRGSPMKYRWTQAVTLSSQSAAANIGRYIAFSCPATANKNLTRPVGS